MFTKCYLWSLLLLALLALTLVVLRLSGERAVCEGESSLSLWLAFSKRARQSSTITTGVLVGCLRSLQKVGALVGELLRLDEVVRVRVPAVHDQHHIRQLEVPKLEARDSVTCAWLANAPYRLRYGFYLVETE